MGRALPRPLGKGKNTGDIVMGGHVVHQFQDMNQKGWTGKGTCGNKATLKKKKNQVPVAHDDGCERKMGET